MVIDTSAVLAILMNEPEAAAIERRLKNITIHRPQTHDLLSNVIEDMGGRLDRIVISDLRDDTFFALLVVEQDGRWVEIDSRPSDAIALGITNDIPIYVEEHVLDGTA